MSREVYLVAYTERRCPTCKKNISALLHDYGLVTPENFDEKVGVNDFPVKPIKCPTCGGVEFPEYMTIYDGDKPLNRIRVGSRDLPVVGGNAPYGVIYTPEEQAELERGMAKVVPLFDKQGQDFWDKYCKFALNNWEECLRELLAVEFQFAYQELKLPVLPGHANTATWRRDAEKRLKTDDDRQRFWRAANQKLIDEFLWDGNVVSWPVETWVKKFGRKRIIYIVLHLPLPEELEGIRTEKLSLIIKKRSGDAGVLFQRIAHLGRELDRQRRRSEELSRTLLELRQEKASVEQKLSEARQLIETLQGEKTIYQRDPRDVQKIREYKGLIGELRSEMKRLEAQLPPVVSRELEEPEEAETDDILAPAKEVSLEVLAGKTIAIFGRLSAEQGAGCKLLWHEGSRADQELESIAREADVYVVLTRLVSHEVMWRLKELAIDQEKKIVFSRETNTEKILARAAGLFYVK